MADVLLKPGRDKAIRNRHPWIFSGAIERVKGQAEDGDVVAVRDTKGAFLTTCRNSSLLRAMAVFSQVIVPASLAQRCLWPSGAPWGLSPACPRWESTKLGRAEVAAVRRFHGLTPRADAV